MGFTKQEAQKMREEINAALTDLGKRLNVDIHAGSCSFSDTEINFKMKVTTADKAAVELKTRKDFEQFATLYGFEPQDFGKEFTAQGNVYTVAGFAPRRSKFNLMGRRVSDGKIFLFVADEIAKRVRVKV